VNAKSFERAQEYARSRLEQELSPNLVYHRFQHTCDEVLPAVETLAGMEGVTGKALNLLCTAAWFHDLGYVENVVYHELISARIAVQVLPSFGFGKAEVEVVRWAILATALPQSPQNPLEEILTDADLGILGSPSFMPRNADLRCELAFLGRQFTDQEWYSGQLSFMEKHRYFTASARAWRGAQKLQNIAGLKNKLKSLKNSPVI